MNRISNILNGNKIKPYQPKLAGVKGNPVSEINPSIGNNKNLRPRFEYRNIVPPDKTNIIPQVILAAGRPRIVQAKAIPANAINQNGRPLNSSFELNHLTLPYNPARAVKRSKKIARLGDTTAGGILPKTTRLEAAETNLKTVPNPLRN